jgi:hypothetical protein
MEHSLRLEEPWRTRAVVAAAVALIELVVILGVVVIVVGKPISHRVSAAAEAKVLAPAKPAAKPVKKAKPAPAPLLERGETSVIVLNGNGRSGAAAETADLVRARGYLIGSVGNAPHNDFSHSVVMYRPGYKREAKRLAQETGVRATSPLDGLTQKDLLGAHLALVVGD